MLRAFALVALIGTDLQQSSARRPNVRRSDEMFTYTMADRPAMLQQVDVSHGSIGISIIRIKSEHMSRTSVVAANFQKCLIVYTSYVIGIQLKTNSMHITAYVMQAVAEQRFESIESHIEQILF